MKLDNPSKEFIEITLNFFGDKGGDELNMTLDRAKSQLKKRIILIYHNKKSNKNFFCYFFVFFMLKKPIKTVLYIK